MGAPFIIPPHGNDFAIIRENPKSPEILFDTAEFIRHHLWDTCQQHGICWHIYVEVPETNVCSEAAGTGKAQPGGRTCPSLIIRVAHVTEIRLGNMLRLLYTNEGCPGPNQPYGAAAFDECSSRPSVVRHHWVSPKNVALCHQQTGPARRKNLRGF